MKPDRIYNDIISQFFKTFIYEGSCNDCGILDESFVTITTLSLKGKPRVSEKVSPFGIWLFCSADVNHSLVFNAVNKALRVFTAIFEEPINVNVNLTIWKYSMFINKIRFTIFVNYNSPLFAYPYKYMDFAIEQLK